MVTGAQEPSTWAWPLGTRAPSILVLGFSLCGPRPRGWWLGHGSQVPEHGNQSLGPWGTWAWPLRNWSRPQWTRIRSKVLGHGRQGPVHRHRGLVHARGELGHRYWGPKPRLTKPKFGRWGPWHECRGSHACERRQTLLLNYIMENDFLVLKE